MLQCINFAGSVDIKCPGQDTTIKQVVQRKTGSKKLKRGQKRAVLNSSALPAALPGTLPLPPQHPPARGGVGLITALSRKWSIFNSCREHAGRQQARKDESFFFFFNHVQLQSLYA